MKSHNSSFTLIVDDDPNNLSVLTRTLKEAGYTTRVAIDGESALEQVSEELPALILLDIMMPGIDGFEVCRRLKQNSSTRDVPIIFMTALADGENKVRGLSTGAVDYITKPFNETEVLARVRIHLQMQNLLDTLQSQNQQLRHEIEQRQIAEAALQKSNAELQRIQIKLIQQEKLTALNDLVAGIVYEINNPIGCISGNIEFVQQYIEQILEHITLYRAHFPNACSVIAAHAKQAEITYIAEDLPRVVQALKRSSDRITAIGKSLNLFTRREAHQSRKNRFNIHELLDSTLLILRHRLSSQDDRAAIEVIKDYGDLPEMPCFPGQLNQAFMNLLTSVVDAFDEEYATSGEAVTVAYHHSQENTNLQLHLTTAVEEDWVVLLIRENVGTSLQTMMDSMDEVAPQPRSIPGSSRLGLSIARQIIVDTHGGQLSHHLSDGNVTEIIVKLPTAPRQ